MTKIQKLYNKVNYEFREILDKEFFNKFDEKVVTTYSYMLLRLITTREDEKEFSKEQLNWLQSFSDGYMFAMEQIID